MKAKSKFVTLDFGPEPRFSGFGSLALSDGNAKNQGYCDCWGGGVAYGNGNGTGWELDSASPSGCGDCYGEVDNTGGNYEED